MSRLNLTKMKITHKKGRCFTCTTSAIDFHGSQRQSERQQKDTKWPGFTPIPKLPKIELVNLCQFQIIPGYPRWMVDLETIQWILRGTTKYFSRRKARMVSRAIRKLDTWDITWELSALSDLISSQILEKFQKSSDFSICLWPFGWVPSGNETGLAGQNP